MSEYLIVVAIGIALVAAIRIARGAREQRNIIRFTHYEDAQ